MTKWIFEKVYQFDIFMYFNQIVRIRQTNVNITETS